MLGDSERDGKLKNALMLKGTNLKTYKNIFT
jgi:hypothetical protein